ncbi:MAG: hypothetical protein R2681_01720 [Pyrinomonadaceae bacterium]
MKVERDMTINDILAIDEEKAICTLEMLSENFERLRHPVLRRAMGGRVTIEQAAKVARVPLSEILYVLNLALGEDEDTLSKELSALDQNDLNFYETNPSAKPEEISNLDDSSSRVNYLDLMPVHFAKRDPLRLIIHGRKDLNREMDVLLIRHPFDPIPLRELFLRRFKMASWAEERKPGEWFIYFYHPYATAKAAAHPQVRHGVYLKHFAAVG